MAARRRYKSKGQYGAEMLDVDDDDDDDDGVCGTPACRGKPLRRRCQAKFLKQQSARQ